MASDDAVRPPAQGAHPNLVVPAWVPQAVAALARHVHAAEILKPPNARGDLPEAIARLATDPRMREVWTELRRRSGGAARNGDFVHAAREAEVVNWPGFAGIRNIVQQANGGDLAQQAGGRDHVQHMACTLLFVEAVRLCTFDRDADFGPRTQSRVEIAREIRNLRNLAARLRAAATTARDIGVPRLAPTLDRFATELEAEAQIPHRNPTNALFVERGRGDPWVHGFVVLLAATCRTLFGTELRRSVAALVNVALDRRDVTETQVRSALTAVRRRRPVRDRR